MLTRTQWFLAKIAEEASEVTHRALKAQQFGPLEVQPDQPHDNLERLHSEIDDLISTWLLFCDEHGPLPGSALPTSTTTLKRREKMEKYLKLSRDLGQVE